MSDLPVKEYFKFTIGISLLKPIVGRSKKFMRNFAEVVRSKMWNHILQVREALMINMILMMKTKG